MKYRIIERIIPELTRNFEGSFDFIPEIEYRTKYIIQEKKSFIHKWIETKNFSLIEQAKVYIKYKQTKTRTKIIKND